MRLRRNGPVFLLELCGLVGVALTAYGPPTGGGELQPAVEPVAGGDVPAPATFALGDRVEVAVEGAHDPPPFAVQTVDAFVEHPSVAAVGEAAFGVSGVSVRVAFAAGPDHDLAFGAWRHGLGGGVGDGHREDGDQRGHSPIAARR